MGYRRSSIWNYLIIHRISFVETRADFILVANTIEKCIPNSGKASVPTDECNFVRVLWILVLASRLPNSVFKLFWWWERVHYRIERNLNWQPSSPLMRMPTSAASAYSSACHSISIATTVPRSHFCFSRIGLLMSLNNILITYPAEDSDLDILAARDGVTFHWILSHLIVVPSDGFRFH